MRLNVLNYQTYTIAKVYLVEMLVSWFFVLDKTTAVIQMTKFQKIDLSTNIATEVYIMQYVQFSFAQKYYFRK